MLTQEQRDQFFRDVQKQSPHGFKVGDRVKVVFADPTAAKTHQSCVGRTGTVEEITKDKPMFGINVWGQQYPYPEGCIHVRFDQPVVERFGTSTCTMNVNYFFAHELDRI